MKPSLVAIALFLAASCRDGSTMRRDQKSYEVVEEGAASGVTSTINGPGETTPPMTGTNADTTTAFALPTTQLPPNTGAAYTPPLPYPVANTTPPPQPAPPREPQAPPVKAAPPPPPTDTMTREPPPTDTAEQEQEEPEDVPPPSTDTSTTTAPPPL